MSDMPATVRQLDATDAETLPPQLVALLQDTVASGASLGFWSPLTADRTRAYWDDVIARAREPTGCSSRCVTVW